jgi:hypothetical protein
MPRKKTATKQSPPQKQSKAAFVRSLSPETTAKEAVAKAKAAGISLSETYFYNIRSTGKGSSKKAPKRTTKKTTTVKGALANREASTSIETNFRRLVLEVGLARAKALIGEVERGLQSVIAGQPR